MVQTENNNTAKCWWGSGINWIASMLLVFVQLAIRVRLFATSWTAACRASPSFTISQSLLKFMSTELMMPHNHLILLSLLLLHSIFHSIRIFSSELALHIRWPKYSSFSFSISPSNEYSGLISLRIDCLCFKFLFFGLEACGILTSPPGIELTPSVLEDDILTTRSPGTSLPSLLQGRECWEPFCPPSKA